MPNIQAAPSAVAGDGRKACMALSDPRKQGSKPVMDHTRRGDLARTNIKALAQILKRSKGHSEGALEEIEFAPILALQCAS